MEAGVVDRADRSVQMVEHTTLADDQHVARHFASGQLLPGVGDLRVQRSEADAGYGRHGKAQLAARSGLNFESPIDDAQRRAQQTGAVGQRQLQPMRIGRRGTRGFWTNGPHLENFGQRHGRSAGATASETRSVESSVREPVTWRPVKVVTSTC